MSHKVKMEGARTDHADTTLIWLSSRTGSHCSDVYESPRLMYGCCVTGLHNFPRGRWCRIWGNRNLMCADLIDNDCSGMLWFLTMRNFWLRNSLGTGSIVDPGCSAHAKAIQMHARGLDPEMRSGPKSSVGTRVPPRSRNVLPRRQSAMRSGKHIFNYDAANAPRQQRHGRG